MYQEVLAIAERWELHRTLNALHEIQEDARVTVGILGDFSSGKSTLINELVDQPELMATRLEPCTASAGLVLSVESVEELACYRFKPDQTLEEISRSELDDVARGLIIGRPVVHVPSSEAFPDGLGLADTPGLSSLTESDLKTTLAELPYLDAAIICIDIQSGGISNSLTDFLSSPGIRHLKHRFLIALTHGDRRGPQATAEVREVTASNLATLLNVSSAEAAERVVVVAGGEVARANGKADVSELRAALLRFLADKRATIKEERRTRAIARHIPAAQALLKERALAVRAEGEDLKVRVDEVEEAIQDLKKQRSEQQGRLDSFQTDLRREVSRTCEAHQATLAAAMNDEQTAAATAALSHAIDATIKRSVGEHQDRFSLGAAVNIHGIAAHIKMMNRGAEVGKTVASAALVAAVLPNAAGAAGVASNAAQASAGGAAQVGVKTGAEAAKTVAKKVAKDKAEGMLKSFFKGVVKKLDDVNPINFAGDLIAVQLKKMTLESYLDDLARSVARQACRELERIYEEEIFKPLGDSLTELSGQLKAAEKDRRLKRDDQERRLRSLDSDIAQLTALLVQ